MRIKPFIAIFCALTVLFTVGAVLVSADNLEEARTVIAGIEAFNLETDGADSIQEWINGPLTRNAGIDAEWNIVTVSQIGAYDFAKYEEALLQYVNNHEIYSAVTRQKYALALVAVGSTDSYIGSVLEDSIGQQGIMSFVYGLHLLNNGYSCSSQTVQSVKDKILSLQLQDGGWALRGEKADVDVTAMTLQALAPYYENDALVKAAVDKALEALASLQLADGDYMSYGVENAESTAQVITALSCLGVDCQTDERYMQEGNTLFHGLKKFQLSDGSFCHQLGGGSNQTATVQAYYAMVSYCRMKEGKESFYLFDRRNPSQLSQSPSSQPEEEKVSSPQKEASSRIVSQPSGSSIVSKPVATVSEEFPSQSSGTETTFSSQPVSSSGQKVVQTPSEPSASSKSGYKLWACLGIMLCAAIICLILFLTHKGNKKNYIAVFLLSILAMGVVLLVNIQSKESYYSTPAADKENTVGRVTLSIRCDTVAGQGESYIPSDGIILNAATFAIDDDDSVYDILVEATKQYNIHMETSGSGEMVYVAGLGYLYEFDYGDLSGWVYHVNGQNASVGCNAYKLSDGDVIEWHYSLELGQDIGS